MILHELDQAVGNMIEQLETKLNINFMFTCTLRITTQFLGIICSI